MTGATPPLHATLEQKLVTVTADPNGASVTITATQATGNDVLHVDRCSRRHGRHCDSRSLQRRHDRSANDADGYRQSRATRLAGAERVTEEVTRLTQALPGARMTIGTVTPPAAPLAPGASIAVRRAGSDRGQRSILRSSRVRRRCSLRTRPLRPLRRRCSFTTTIPSTSRRTACSFAGRYRQRSPRASTTITMTATDPRRLVVALRTSLHGCQRRAVDRSLRRAQHGRHAGRAVGDEALLAGRRPAGRDHRRALGRSAVLVDRSADDRAPASCGNGRPSRALRRPSRRYRACRFARRRSASAARRAGACRRRTPSHRRLLDRRLWRREPDVLRGRRGRDDGARRHRSDAAERQSIAPTATTTAITASCTRSTLRLSNPTAAPATGISVLTAARGSGARKFLDRRKPRRRRVRARSVALSNHGLRPCAGSDPTHGHPDDDGWRFFLSRARRRNGNGAAADRTAD